MQSLAYGFDAAGDLKTANDNVDSTRNQAFAYDALYHLTQASGTYGTYAYGYDADGNRSSISLTGGSNNFSASYAYAANSNQLQTVTSGSNVRSLTYTADGNTLQDNLGTGAVFGYAYSNDNRLIQASLGGVTQASYTLNYLGQRVIKAAVQTGTTHFHYDRAGHLIAESDGSGNLLDEYVWLGDAPLAFVTPTGGIDYIHADHLGTPQKMTDANQNIVWDGGTSDPFMMNALPTTTPPMNLRLPGQYYDAETAHHYNYFRDYDPSLGRYIESDPIGLGGGINTYAYAEASPVNEFDGDGQQAVPFTPLIPPPPAYGGNSAPGMPTPYSQPPSWLRNFFQNLFNNGDSDTSDPQATSPDDNSSDPMLSSPDDLPGDGGHDTNVRPSTKDKHEKGDARRKKDRNDEKGDRTRRPPRQRPDNWDGPWPPKPPQVCP